MSKKKGITEESLSHPEGRYCFQDSNLEGDVGGIIKGLWDNRLVDFVQLETIGTRGGIIILWDIRVLGYLW